MRYKNAIIIIILRIRDDAGEQPVVVAAVPDLVVSARRQRALLVGPQSVQLSEAAVRDVEHEASLLLLT